MNYFIHEQILAVWAKNARRSSGTGLACIKSTVTHTYLTRTISKTISPPGDSTTALWPIRRPSND
jgi:hypothetical protein